MIQMNYYGSFIICSSQSIILKWKITYKKKTSAAAASPTAAAHIIKNMIKRRQHTSTVVYQLYTHAYTNEGNVSVIYPKDKDNIANQLIKSFQTNRLKTTSVLLRRGAATSATSALHAFLNYIITTQSISIGSSTVTQILDKINHIKYRHKDIIILALTGYMKIEEDDINKKNIFISATPEEENFAAAATTATSTATDPPFACHPPSLATDTPPYDYKYKYLYS